MPTANQEVLDRGVRHAIHLARLRTHEVNQIVGFLNDDVLPDARKKLAARLERVSTRGLDRGPHTTKALREMIEATQGVVDGGLTTAGLRLGGDLNDIALTEAEWQQRALAGSLPGELAVDLGVNRPTVKQLNGILGSRPFEGDLFKNWWKKLRASAKADIGQQVQIGIASGETNQQIVRRLAGTKAGRYMDGAFGKLRRNVASTVQTATNHVSTQTREMTYKANEDIVKGVRIVATLDHRTTEICMGEDGKVYPVNDGPRPPFHWNCRTTTAPELRSLSELGLDPREFSADVRARMTGHAPRRESYGTWLRRQPAAVQDDALGPRKGRLFRKHQLRVDSFVDDKRRVLTLDELRAKEGLDVRPELRQPVVPYKKSATFDEAVDQMRRLSRSEIAFVGKKMSSSTRKTITTRMDAASKRLAETRRRLPRFNRWVKEQTRVRYVDINPERYVRISSGLADAYYDPTLKTIVTGRGNKATGAVRLGGSRYVVSSSFDATYMHEVGHGYRLGLATPLRKRWNAIYDSTGRDQTTRTRWWKKRVSKYAGTHSDEAFSECFSAYTHPDYGGVNLRLPTQIEEFFKDVIGG